MRRLFFLFSLCILLFPFLVYAGKADLEIYYTANSFGKIRACPT